MFRLFSSATSREWAVGHESMFSPQDENIVLPYIVLAGCPKLSCDDEKHGSTTEWYVNDSRGLEHGFNRHIVVVLCKEVCA